MEPLYQPLEPGCCKIGAIRASRIAGTRVPGKFDVRLFVSMCVRHLESCPRKLYLYLGAGDLRPPEDQEQKVTIIQHRRKYGFGMFLDGKHMVR